VDSQSHQHKTHPEAAQEGHHQNLSAAAAWRSTRSPKGTLDEGFANLMPEPDGEVYEFVYELVDPVERLAEFPATASSA
jgi:hypothetical protein